MRTKTTVRSVSIRSKTRRMARRWAMRAGRYPRRWTSPAGSEQCCRPPATARPLAGGRAGGPGRRCGVGAGRNV